MRSSVDAAAFYKAMTALMDIPAKSPVKVLQEIKAEFTADHCTLSATDFGTWLSVTIPASGDDFAFVFWNSAGVQKVCRYFTGQLELELSGQRKSQIITMRCGDKGGKFPVYEAEECPTWPEFEAKQKLYGKRGKHSQMRQAGKVCRRSAQHQTGISGCSVPEQAYLGGGRSSRGLL